MPLGPTGPGHGPAWSRARSHDVDEPLVMSAPGAVDTDVAIGTSCRGRAEIDLGTVLARASVPVGAPG